MMEWRIPACSLIFSIKRISLILILLPLCRHAFVSSSGGSHGNKVIPSVVTIGLFAPKDAPLLDATINFTLSKIHKGNMLPRNTTLVIKKASTQAAYQLVNEFRLADVAAMIETPGSSLKSELIADVLNATSIKTGLFDCDELYQADDYTMCDHTVTLHQSLRTVNNGLIPLLKHLKVTQLIILYDVLRAKQVSQFVEQGKGIITKYVMVYLNFDKTGQINPHSLSDLKHVNKHGIKNLIAFCHPNHYELLIDVVNLYAAVSSDDGLLWILPVLPGGYSITAGPMDKVVGYRLSTTSDETPPLLKYIRSNTDYGNDGLPDSAALVHDSLLMLSKAIATVIENGHWVIHDKNVSSQNSNGKSDNAEKVTSALHKVSLHGITGKLTLGTKRQRNQTSLELLFLQKNKFHMVAKYSSEHGLNVSGHVKKNRELPSFKSGGRVIRAVAMQQHPFVLVNQASNNKNYTFSGYSYDVLKRLCQDLNLQFEITHVQGNNMDALVDRLTSGAADIILNPVIVSAKRQRSVVFTKPLMHFSVALMIRQKQKGELDLTQFMLPFTVPAWCLLLCSWFVVTLIVHVLDRYSPYGWRQKQKRVGEKGDEFSLFNSLWFCLACILTQGADHTPRNLSGRVLACCFWFCILIWNATYTANLASFLTLKDTSLPVSSLENAKEQGYQITVIKDSAIAHVLNISTVPTHVSVWNDIKATNSFVNNHLEGSQKCREGKTGFIAEKPFLEYIAGRKPCELALNFIMGWIEIDLPIIDHREKHSYVSNVLQPMSFAFALPLNSKFVDSLSLGILRLQEKGVTESFERKWWEYRNQCPKTQQEVSQSRLDVKEMLGVYLVLAVGIVFSFLAVAGEIWWKNGLGEKMQACCGGFLKRENWQVSEETEEKEPK